MEILAEINRIFQEVLNIEAPGADVDLVATGVLDSLAIVRLIAEFQQRFGITVDLEDVALDGLRTTGRLAELVERSMSQDNSPVQAPAPEQSNTMVLMRNGSGPPIFFVHAAWGSALSIQPLATSLSTSRPIYGLQAAGIDPDEEPRRSVEDMAQAYVQAVRAVQPKGPFTVGGYSFGGLVAFEMARLLTTAGDQVELLALIDPEAHYSALPIPARSRFLLKLPFRYVRYILAAPRARVPRYLRNLLLRLFPWLPIDQRAPVKPPPPQYRRVMRASDEAALAYRPGYYDGDAVLFLGESRAPGECDPSAVWSRMVRGRLEIKPIPGDHAELLSGTNVTRLGQSLSPLLETNGSLHALGVNHSLT